MANAPLNMANPLRVTKDWVFLVVDCARDQTRDVIRWILSQIPPKYLNDFLVVTEDQSFTQIVNQWLSILRKIKQTEVCFDYRWAKLQIPLDMSKAQIDIERSIMIVTWCWTLNEYYRFVWWGYAWDIHLPNWILRAKIETKWAEEFVFTFPSAPYWFYDSCERGKRNSLRAEINTLAKAKNFFHELVLIKRAEEKWKTQWKVPSNLYHLANHEWVVKWIVKNISAEGIGFYVPNWLARHYKIGWKYPHILPFFSRKLLASLVIRNVSFVEWENFAEVWASFDFSRVPADKYDIEDFVWDLNREIADEILRLKRKDLPDS